MITMDEWTTIRVLHRKGVGIREIAGLLGLSRNTVRRYLREEEPPSYHQAEEPLALSGWDRYREQILEMVFVKHYRGSRIFEELKSQGAPGKRSSFYEYLRKIREDETHLSRVRERFESGPGEQAQFDWSEYTVEIAGQLEKIYVFLTILGYSRYKCFVVAKNVKQATILDALERAFSFFEGTPKTLLVDNARQMVDNPSRQQLTFNRNFAHFLAYYRVEPRACQVRHPFTKGKVERPFEHLEEHFIKGQSFADWQALETALEAYTHRVNHTVHGETQEKPVDRWQQERPHLHRLPQKPYIYLKENWRKVNWDCLLSFEGNKYSVPYPYAGKEVWVRPYLGHTLRIYSQKGELIAQHKIPAGKKQIVKEDAHYAGLRKTTPQSAGLVRDRFLSLFPQHEAFLQGLAAVKRLNWKREVQKILQLTELYATEAIQAALESALRHNIYSFNFIYAYLQRHHDIQYHPPQPLGSPRWDTSFSVERDLTIYDHIK